ncbi:MAG: NADH:ubiquinone reductase (Na(+)-transporting) subunit F [Bacteroidota bacterium]
MDLNVIIASTVGLFVITLLLVTMLLVAKERLLPSGPVKLLINGEKNVEVNSGDTLLTTLGNNKIFLPSACGGGGTCIQCKCQVLEGGGEILPTEEPHFTRKEISEGWRLGCQVKVKQDMKIEVPEEVFGIKKWQAKVKSNYNVASFIKEFVIEIPEEMDYKAGGYIQIEIPECDVNYDDIDITSHPKEHPDDPQKFKLEWDNFNLWSLNMKNNETVERAYSMASYPAEGKEIMLNVRIATPPWDPKIKNWSSVNPGIASSYIFSRKSGDTVTISGPYGEFFINESEAEMLYVGGGAGMAPMRSHLYELFRTLKTGRKVTFWYGGRSKRELFYVDHFRALEKDFPNFKFYIALSEPLDEDNWKVKNSLDGEGDGFVGFIHQVVIDNYLSKHESPEDIEVYFCGPPLMNQAVEKMAEDFGVPPENVRFDDFGG